ncbi:MAG: hypothetical protein JSS20_12120 [Proteobacteria bacterium]|nr:hypothetical protein [Pseudomonadota bacterium]
MSAASSADGIWRKLPFWVALGTGFGVSLLAMLGGIGRFWSVGIALVVASFLFIMLSVERPTQVASEGAKRQRMRSLAIGLGLGFLVIVFYAATIIRLGPNALRREGGPPSVQRQVPAEAQDAAACKRAGTC